MFIQLQAIDNTTKKLRLNRGNKWKGSWMDLSPDEIKYNKERQRADVEFVDGRLQSKENFIASWI